MRRETNVYYHPIVALYRGRLLPLIFLQVPNGEWPWPIYQIESWKKIPEVLTGVDTYEV